MTDPLGKDAARAVARVTRDSIADPDQRDRAALAVRDRLAELALPASSVGGYWPLGSELDVRPAPPAPCPAPGSTPDGGA